jgi:hypothetical protein
LVTLVFALLASRRHVAKSVRSAVTCAKSDDHSATVHSVAFDCSKVLAPPRTDRQDSPNENTRLIRSEYLTVDTGKPARKYFEKLKFPIFPINPIRVSHKSLTAFPPL